MIIYDGYGHSYNHGIVASIVISIHTTAFFGHAIRGGICGSLRFTQRMGPALHTQKLGRSDRPFKEDFLELDEGNI